jgi:hypothetical protein
MWWAGLVLVSEITESVAHLHCCLIHSLLQAYTFDLTGMVHFAES